MEERVSMVSSSAKRKKHQRSKHGGKRPNLRLRNDAIRKSRSKDVLDGTRLPSSTLRAKALERLNAARFRYINEKLYTTTGEGALEFFAEDPEAFGIYHKGYAGQVAKWPLNPLHLIIRAIKRMSPSLVIADLGCGDAKLARKVPNKVHSFDLVAVNKRVTACDMAKVPLQDGSVDVAVYCLSLMGTNVAEYLAEANRILKMGGMLKIADIESRFTHVGMFVKALEKMGFKLVSKDGSHKMFLFFDFKKARDVGPNAFPIITLEPCKYKRR